MGQKCCFAPLLASTTLLVVVLLSSTLVQTSGQATRMSAPRTSIRLLIDDGRAFTGTDSSDEETSAMPLSSKLPASVPVAMAPSLRSSPAVAPVIAAAGSSYYISGARRDTDSGLAVPAPLQSSCRGLQCAQPWALPAPAAAPAAYNRAPSAAPGRLDVPGLKFPARAQPPTAFKRAQSAPKTSLTFGV